MDDRLKTEEEEDYLDRIETCPETHTEEGFKQRQFSFGTLALLTNMQEEAAEVYKTYKVRIEVEKLANVLKNTLEVDRSYMRDQATLEGWMFINHIAAIIYYRLYNLLLKKGLLSKYSPKDLIDYMMTIKKLHMNGQWVTSEITHKTRALLKLLDLSIT